MSRREYDRYDERQSDYNRRGGRTDRDYEEVDYQRTRYEGPAPSRRNETTVKERESDTVVSQGRRTDRGPRQPDFLREDYGRNENAGQLVVREERRDEEQYVSRGTRSRAPQQERDQVVYRERSRGPPYPRSEVGSTTGQDEVVFRDRIYPRPGEEIDIKIKEKETDRGGGRGYRDDEEVTYRQNDRLQPRGRGEVDREEITFRQERSRSRPPPPRGDVVEKEDITIRERSRGPPPRRGDTVEEIDIDIKERERDGPRGRDVRKEEIDINIKERDRSEPPPVRRSASRGALVRKDREEWIVRRPRTPSPSPSPPPRPRDYEKEEITIRRKERSPSPDPEPEPLPLPVEPVYRPPIIQEVITHHRHIDHPIERPPEPPPPPPTPPPAKEEEDIDINIHRSGIRNGKPFDENINIDIDTKERERNQQIARREDYSSSSTDLRRSVSTNARNRARFEDDDVSREADYYNRRVSGRGYPGEAWNGATRDWGVADIPPGTERVAMDGVGGGRQEITWDRYNGERHGKFVTNDRVYDGGYGNGSPAPIRPPPRDDYRESTFSETRIESQTSRGHNRDRKWTEISKELVIEEAIKECGYEYEESDRYFYVMQYLRYVSQQMTPNLCDETTNWNRRRTCSVS